MKRQISEQFSQIKVIAIMHTKTPTFLFLFSNKALLHLFSLVVETYVRKTECKWKTIKVKMQKFLIWTGAKKCHYLSAINPPDMTTHFIFLLTKIVTFI